jgi:elongator complex protein 2
VVRHYLLEAGELRCRDELCFPLSKMVESLCSFVVGDSLMLFLGSVDTSIHYYEKALSGSAPFAYKFTLLGHENAITKLTASKAQGEDLLLASASKDGYIRLWRVTADHEVVKFHKNVQQLLGGRHIYLESVLISHECSVTSLCWTRFGGELQLASCSLDSTICLWSAQQHAWHVTSRLGQFLGNKNAYFDCITDPLSTRLVALNFTGAVLIWEWRGDKFVLRPSFSGHCGEVSSLEWNHSGDFLVSASKDQTTRVFARNSKSSSFNEISRAQIHGYDINAVTTIKVKDSTLDVIVCGADEKVVRIIEPPACFANYLNTFTHANLHLFFNSPQEEAKYLVSSPTDKVLLYEAYSEGGSQVLGLMTKAQLVEREKITSYFEEEEAVNEEAEQEEAEDLSKAKLDYSEPPHEDFLVKHTLWPEVNKLYAHPHEIQTLARNNASTMLASACKALSKDSASIIIWNTLEWKILKVLPFHSYTVYALEFSPRDTYLASASKDRQLAVFSNAFNLLFSYEAHLRAVTSLSFHLSEVYLLTGSRDKTIKLHSLEQRKAVSELNLKQPISAVAFSRLKERPNLFAVGFFNGDVLVGELMGTELVIRQHVPDCFGHSAEVKALRWKGQLLASCSSDFSVRVFEVTEDEDSS